MREAVQPVFEEVWGQMRRLLDECARQAGHGSYVASPWRIDLAAYSAPINVKVVEALAALASGSEPAGTPDGWVLLNRAGGRVNVDGSVIWQELEKAAHYAGEFALTPVYFGAPASEPSERLREAFAAGFHEGTDWADANNPDDGHGHADERIVNATFDRWLSTPTPEPEEASNGG